MPLDQIGSSEGEDIDQSSLKIDPRLENPATQIELRSQGLKELEVRTTSFA